MMRILDNLNRRLLMATIAMVSLGSAWSYGDERLLLVSGGVIYAVNSDGTELRSVIEEVSPEFMVTLSPNGRWIIVQRPNWNKEVINLESGAVVASMGTYTADFSWSPDNEMIAYQDGGRLFVIRRNGSDQRKIVESGSKPQWDPLNPQLIYYTHSFQIDGANINVVDIDSGESHMVRQGMHLMGKAPFSPDGTRLLVSDCRDGTSCIKILNLATGEVTGPIGPSGWKGADNPAWSPDGTQIAFTVAEGVGGLHVAEVTDVESRMLVGGDLNVATPFNPVWSPVGNAIAFSITDWTGRGGHEIYVIRPDGSGLRKVADGDQVLWWTEASEEQPTYMRLKTWGTIKQDSR